MASQSPCMEDLSVMQGAFAVEEGKGLFSWPPSC